MLAIDDVAGTGAHQHNTFVLESTCHLQLAAHLRTVPAHIHFASDCQCTKPRGKENEKEGTRYLSEAANAMRLAAKWPLATTGDLRY